MKRLILCFTLILCLVLPCAAMAERAYLIPDSNTRQLTETELWEWDYESLGYIMNEIFARHGYNFIPGEKYDYYFRCMPWYTPNADPDNQRACYSQLNNVEWYNEALVKKVRAQMRESGNYNTGGKSVWDYFSTGFDTLQGFDYVALQSGQQLAVYSAPNKASWRGSDGKAAVSTNGNVFAAGWESGWLLVMYETNYSSVRVGYVDGSTIRGSVPVNRMLFFEYQNATVTRRCTLTDDPARTNSAMTILAQGAQVTYLTTFFNNSSWAYIETVVDGQIARGFIPSNCLQVQQAVETADLIDVGK